MQNNHTMKAFDYFFDLLAADSAKIWADLDLLGDTFDAEKWKVAINDIARDYLLTPRFALMRILCNRATSQKADEDPEKISYTVNLDQDLITYSNISLEHARTLSVEEHINYLKHLNRTDVLIYLDNICF